MSSRRGFGRLAPMLGGIVLMMAPRAALADTQLGPQGSPIRTSNYSLDLFQGPVLASARITSLGGAFVAIAEGTDGIAFNPAAVSLRPPFSTTFVDYDLTGGLTFPSGVANTDFDNDGKRGFNYQDFIWGSLGGNLQFGSLGVGLLVSAQNYALGPPSGAPTRLPGTDATIEGFTVRLLRYDLVGSYGFLKEQLHIGGGLRMASLFGLGSSSGIGAANDGSFSLGTVFNQRQLFVTHGIGGQVGTLWTPYDLPLRVGATFRTPVFGAVDEAASIEADAEGNRSVGDFYLPRKVQLPWELEWGVALQIGKRRFNERWIDEDTLNGPQVQAERRRLRGDLLEPTYKTARRILQRREEERPRPVLLLTSSVLVSGIVDNAVGFESMLDKVVSRSGERVTTSLRLGAEAEVIPRWLQIRAGTYMEPTRFRDEAGTRIDGDDEVMGRARVRLHGTAGLQAKFLRWSAFDLFPERTWWRISLSGDVSRQYFGWGFGIGVWR